MCFLKILEIHNDGSSPSGHPKETSPKGNVFFVRSYNRHRRKAMSFFVRSLAVEDVCKPYPHAANEEPQHIHENAISSDGLIVDVDAYDDVSSKSLSGTQISIVSPSLLISQKEMFFSSVNSFMRQEDSKPVVKCIGTNSPTLNRSMN